MGSGPGRDDSVSEYIYSVGAALLAQDTDHIADTAIEACLGDVPDRLYQMGIRSKVSRSTLVDANEKRDWRIYADFAQS